MKEPDSEGFGHKAARNAAHTLGGQGGKFLLQLASVVVLARLLSEEDFGLVGMVLAIIGIGHILKDFGLASAAIQARFLTRGQRDNLFWLNSAAGAVLAGGAAACATLLESFYQRAGIAEIVLWLAPTLLFAGMTTQYRADLTRRLQLGRAASADLAATALGLIAGVTTALWGWGPGALIAQQLVGGLAGLLLFAAGAQWLPRWYSRKEEMRPLFGVGMPLFVSQVLTYIVNNADAVVIGRMFGPAPVGLYNRGLQLVRVPMNQLRGPLDVLSLSVLAKLQDDEGRFLQFLRRGHLVMIYPLLAAAGGLIAAAPPVVDLALGPRWAEAAVYIQFIALGEAMNSLASAGAWVYTSRGLGGSLLRFTVFSAIIRVGFLIGGAAFGPLGVAAGFAAAQTLLWPISLWRVGRISGVPTGALIVTALRVILVCAIPAGATWSAVVLMSSWPSYAVVPVSTLVHLAAFAALAAVPIIRRDYVTIHQTGKMAKRRS